MSFENPDSNFEEERKESIIPPEEIEAERRDMEGIMPDNGGIEREQKTVERPVKIIKKEGGEETVFDIAFDSNGRKIRESSGKEVDFSGPKSREHIKDFFYGEKGNLVAESQRNFSAGWFDNKDLRYDEKGRVINERWEERPYGKKTYSDGEINYEYKDDENGKTLERTGCGKSDTAYILTYSAYRYHPENKQIIENETRVNEYFAGPLADTKERNDRMIFRQQDQDGRTVVEAIIIKNKKTGEDEQTITESSYNEKGDLIHQTITKAIGDKVEDKKKIDYELVYGKVEVDQD